jgi:hypothetical protein
MVLLCVQVSFCALASLAYAIDSVEFKPSFIADGTEFKVNGVDLVIEVFEQDVVFFGYW